MDAYRSVIQNIATADNARLRAEYGICRGRKELRFIDGITHSLITGHINFENIKALLTEILRQNHQEIKLELRESDIIEWCSDVDAYNAIYAHVDKLKEVVNADDEYRSCYELLRNYNAIILDKQSELRSVLEVQAENIAKLEKEREDFKEKSEENHSSMSAYVATAASKLKEQEIKVKALEDMQANFEEKNAAVWAHELENRAEVLEELNKNQEMLKAATSKVADLKHSFELKKADTDKKFIIRKSKLEAQINNLQMQKKEELLANEQNYKQQELEAKSNYQTRLTKYKDKINELQAKQKNLNFIKDHIEIDPALLQRLSEANQNEKNYLSELRTLEKELRANNKELTEHTKVHQNITQKIEKEANNRTSLKNKLNEKERIASQNTNMLAGFLNENINSWQDSIGKIINNDLLSRTDLHPEIIQNDEVVSQSKENDSNVQRIQIANVSLDISALPCIATTEDELAKEIVDLKHKIEESNNKISSLEKDLLTEDDKIASITAKIQLLESKVNADDNIQLLRNRIEMCEHDIAEFKGKQTIEINAELNEITKELKQTSNTLTETENELRDILKNFNDAFLLNNSDIEIKYQENIEALTTELKEISSKNKDDIAHYNQIMREKMAEGHIDDNLLAELETLIKRNQERLIAMDKNVSLVNEYKTWLNTGGLALNDERNKLNSLNHMLLDAKSNLKDLEDEIKYTLANYKSEIEKLHSDNKQAITLSQKIKSILESFSNKNISPLKKADTDNSLHIETVLQSSIDALNKFTQLQKSLKNNLADISGTLSRYQGNVICSYWEQARDPEKVTYEFSGNEDFEQRHLIIDAGAAKILLNNILPTQKRSLIDNARNISHMISEYYYHLTEFDNRIKGFSSRISQIVQANLQFGAFDNFNICLEPRITKLTGWEYMKEITEYYTSWESNGGLIGELPNANFIQKMLGFAQKFVNGQLKNEMSDYFDVVFEVVENGKFKRATSAKELEDLSSNGLTFLLICALYISLINETRDERNIVIHWPVDEMSKLSNKNIHLLLDVMDKNKIVMVSAAPDLSSAVALKFKNIYRIAKDGVYMNAEALNPIGSAISKMLGVNAND